MHALFQNFEITPMGVLCVAGWILAGIALGKLLYRDDRQLKELQREANDLSQELATWGFTLLPPILTDLALLDFIQLRTDFRNAVKVLRNPITRRAELAKLLAGMVKEEMQDVNTRQAFFDSVYNAAKTAGLKPTTP